ncbi:PfkB family carbohydrate kinase [Glycocaulis sp.]|uniref:PfkB family carbohydrate kinase n=1 Tax=Glycocaulis sp. TaxID=1969725 RepID=UPI003D1C8888
MDRSIIILSSLVAGSRVGGGVGAAVLTRAGYTPEHVPTVIFGRHPGLGAPGGGAVPDGVFQGALDGLLAHGAHSRARAILTGYFASAEQVRAAAVFIQAAKTANPDIFVLVDPICGDGIADGTADGLYVRRETAEAIAARLVPLADLITPNAFELAFLTGRPVTDTASARSAANTLARPVLVTSVPEGADRLAVLLTDGRTSCSAAVERLEGVPHGTGDLLAALALVARLEGETGSELCQHVTEVCERVIRASLEARSHDLLLGALEHAKPS